MFSKSIIFSALAGLSVITTVETSQAQIKTPAPSPSASISQTIGLVDAKVEYSRPSAKGRKIFGDVVPMDKIWRTGANGPTKVTFSDSVTIGGYNPIEKVYAYDPVPKELTTDDAGFVLGAQANVWTEYIENTRKVEYMVFPRMAALSEVLWSGKEKKNKERKKNYK